jgi:mannose-6-phosphate isomerase class I
MSSIPFQTTDWSTIPETEHPGETGMAYWKTIQYDSFRVRMVVYSQGYKADHWCEKGHIIYCIDGEMTSELQDGKTHTLKKGMSYQVSDDASSHRSITKNGATLFILDGNFLK